VFVLINFGGFQLQIIYFNCKKQIQLGLSLLTTNCSWIWVENVVANVGWSSYYCQLSRCIEICENFPLPNIKSKQVKTNVGWFSSFLKTFWVWVSKVDFLMHNFKLVIKRPKQGFKILRIFFSPKFQNVKPHTF
jgi:hypothetical protein